MRPGFPSPRLLAFGNRPAILFQSPGSGNVTGGINQNAAQAGVIARLPVQQQQAGLGRNQNPDLIGNFLPVTTLEPFFIEEDEDMAFQFPAICQGKTGIHRITVHQKVAPFGGERPVPNPVTAAFFEKSEHASPERPPAFCFNCLFRAWRVIRRWSCVS